MSAAARAGTARTRSPRQSGSGAAGAPLGSGAGGPLPRGFYDRPVLEVARALIGCVVSRHGVSGAIVETEAYHDSEPASHAFAGLTARTRTLFGRPGYAYVYRSYGIHAMLNAVCEPEGVGAAVLIRALHPLTGIESMRERRNRRLPREPADLPLRELCSGPGKLCQALAVPFSENGRDLCGGGPITISRPPPDWQAVTTLTGVRVGITKAAELPWRFCVAGSEHVSRPRLG